MGKSDAFDESSSFKLLILCIHNMPATQTRLVILSSSLCRRLGQDLTSAPDAKRISHEYVRYPDVAMALAFTCTETIEYPGKESKLYRQTR